VLPIGMSLSSFASGGGNMMFSSMDLTLCFSLARKIDNLLHSCFFDSIPGIVLTQRASALFPIKGFSFWRLI